MIAYINPEWESLLKNNALSTFEQLWNVEASWVEQPNADRGGASGVVRMELACPEGRVLPVYLKRQRGHVRRSFSHPWRGEPTFAREFCMLRHLKKHGVVVPEPVFYAERELDGDVCAVLLVRELTGYSPLDEVAERVMIGGMEVANRRKLLAAVAREVRAMHDAGVYHRSLYPKHIFVGKAEQGYRAALIDLEKSRFSHVPAWSAIFDLATLASRSQAWGRRSMFYFFMKYHGVERLSWWHKLQSSWISRRLASRLERKRKI